MEKANQGGVQALIVRYGSSNLGPISLRFVDFSRLRVGPWTKAYGTPLIYALDLISRTRGWLIFEDVWCVLSLALHRSWN